MKGQHQCARCGRTRYADRLRSIPGRVAQEAALWVCVATASCRAARRAAR